MWDLILRCKHSRTIVLTTHHIEEADLLADNVSYISLYNYTILKAPRVKKGRFAGTGTFGFVPPDRSRSELFRIWSHISYRFASVEAMPICFDWVSAILATLVISEPLFLKRRLSADCPTASLDMKTIQRSWLVT